MQIPKAQKTVKESVFFALLGSACVKAESKMLMKSNPWSQFHQRFMSNFKSADSEKKTEDLTVFFALL
jgi:hypothetical protein